MNGWQWLILSQRINASTHRFIVVESSNSVIASGYIDMHRPHYNQSNIGASWRFLLCYGAVLALTHSSKSFDVTYQAESHEQQEMKRWRTQNNYLKQVCWNGASHSKSHGVSKSQRPYDGPKHLKDKSGHVAPRQSGLLASWDLAPFWWPAKTVSSTLATAWVCLQRGYTRNLSFNRENND